MTHIILDKLSVGFPVLHAGHRSLKKSLLATATGGVILRRSRTPPFVRALHGVSAAFQAGDRIGLVGPNGAGKTTLLRAIAGIYEPVSGRVQTEGRITTLLDINLGFHQDMTGRENIILRGMYLGIRPKQMRRLAPEISAFTGLGDYLDMPILTYSSGMQLRLSFAIATSIRSDILLMDEWVLAGDAAFLAKAEQRMEEFVESSRIFVLASHSAEIIRKWCNKALFLDAGELRLFGDTDHVLDAYEKSVLQ